tara:strand:- start:7 stop:1902 length:1896 start_codon:yes stop_codon:yes gene_type:complete
MGKKNTSWKTIFKQIDEKFELLHHQDSNTLPLSYGQYEEEVFNLDGNKVTTRPVNNQWAEKTSVPYVQKKDKNGIKHVEVGFFTPKDKIAYVTEKEWLKESVNIFNSALVKRTTLVLEKNEDKIKLSIFNFCKSRNVGHRYFAKQSNDIHITFNLKTKNFYITKSTFVNRRRNTNTTKNDFSKIISTIYPLTFTNPFVSLSHPQYKNLTKNSPTVSPLKALVGLVEELDLDFNVTSYDTVSPSELLAHIIMEWFVKVWGIKTPNNYSYYLLKHYPGIKKLRKYNMNLVHTILNERGLTGKFYNRLLNIEPEYNITDIHFLKHILGDDGVKRIQPYVLSYSRNFEDTKFTKPANLITNIGYCDELSKYEKNKIINIYNTCENPIRIQGFIDLLLDHLKIKNKLQGYGLNKKIKAKTVDEFNEEHSEWSNLLHECERTTQVNYLYPDNFLNHIEKPIQLEGETYFIKVLKNDSDYFKEGQIQHHCVRTYLDKYKSIIISVRKNHESGTERMTCEFLTNTEITNSRYIKDYSNAPTMVQARMKYNKNPEGNWEVIMKVIRKEFLDYVCKPRNATRPIIKITNNITNHIEILKYNSETNQYSSSDTNSKNQNNILISNINRHNNYQNYMRDDLPF